MYLAFIPFLLLIIPILEIGVFIAIGKEIGLWPTLGLIVVTAFIGTLLLRHQGFRLVREIRAKADAGELPGRELVHGVMLLAAGILLLTPGFVTDTCGFLLFFPTVRDRIWRFVRAHMTMEVKMPHHTRNPAERQGRTIDLDTTEFGPKDPDSPWRKK